MKHRFARQLGDTADACIRYHFVYDHRVGDVCLDPYFASNFASDKTSKVTCMLHSSIYQVVCHIVIDLVDTAFDGFAHTASSDDCIDTFEVNVMLGKGFLYQVLAPRELIRDSGKACKVFGLVSQRCCQYRLVVIVYGDFGRCRSGVDGENTIHIYYYGIWNYYWVKTRYIPNIRRLRKNLTDCREGRIRLFLDRQTS